MSVESLALSMERECQQAGSEVRVGLAGWKSRLQGPRGWKKLRTKRNLGRFPGGAVPGDNDVMQEEVLARGREAREAGPRWLSPSGGCPSGGPEAQWVGHRGLWLGPEGAGQGSGPRCKSLSAPQFFLLSTLGSGGCWPQAAWPLGLLVFH